VAVLFHQGVVAGKSVQYATVLHVGTGSHLDSAEVASQASQRSDVAIWSDDDVADQDCGRVNVGAWGYDRNHAVD